MQTLTNMTHNETNTSCPQNRCGEWSKCNNGECEGIHDCTCETPIESWEKELENIEPECADDSHILLPYPPLLNFIRTKLDEAYRKGVRAGQLEAVAAYLKAVLGHAGEVSKD